MSGFANFLKRTFFSPDPIPNMPTLEQSEGYEQTPETSSRSRSGGNVAAAEAMPRDIDFVPEDYRHKPATSQAQAMIDEQAGMKTVRNASVKSAISQDKPCNQQGHSGSEQKSTKDMEHTTSSTQYNTAIGRHPEKEKSRVHGHSTSWNQAARSAPIAPAVPKDEQPQGIVQKARQKEIDQRARVQSKDEVIAHLHNTIVEHKRDSNARARQYEKAVSERTLLLEKRTRELHGAQAEICALKKDLEDCKGRIFAMQPVQGMTDTQLLDSYQDLCRNIEDCVETCFDDVDNALISMANAQKTDKTGSLVWKTFAPNELQAINENSSVDKPMLTSFIFRVLYNGILRENLPIPGMSVECQLLLNALIDGIGNLHPEKDQEACKMWRLDTHRALRVTQSAKECEKSTLSQIADGLMKSFKDVVPREKQTAMNKEKLDNIISMAAELASNTRLSMAEHGFYTGVDPEGGAENRNIFAKDLKSYAIIDSRTGLPLRSNSQPRTTPDGRVGEIVTWVFPGFFRSGTKKTRNLELCKPVIVVKFDHEVPRGGRRKPPVEKDQDCNMAM